MATPNLLVIFSLVPVFDTCGFSYLFLSYAFHFTLTQSILV